MKQVLVVRTDLGMSVGKIGSQVAHAAAGIVMRNPGHPNFVMWGEGD